MNETPPPGSSAPVDPAACGALYCYRCKNILKLSPEWCGTCGAEQFDTCRNCGLVYNKIHYTCPSCGTKRRRSHRGGITRAHRDTEIFSLFRQNRLKLFYIAAGVTGGILIGAIVKALAAHSGPPNGQGYEITSLMYWLDPFIKAATTIYQAFVEILEAIFHSIINLILNNFKTTILAFIGGVIGFILATKTERDRRRLRRKKAHREARSEDPRAKAE